MSNNIQVFSGNPAEYETFKFQIDVAIEAEPERYLQQPPAFFALLVSRTKGSALQWLMKFKREQGEFVQNMSSPNQLWEQMDKRFSNPNLKLQADHQLYGCKQRHNQSLMDFTDWFVELSASSTFNDETLRHAYSRALRSNLQQAINLSGKRPRSLADLINLAMRLEQTTPLEAQAPRRQPPSSMQPMHRPVQASDAVPMELGMTTTSSTPKFTSRAHSLYEQRMDRRRRGVCTYCGKSAHTLEDCAELKKKRAATPNA